MKRLFFMLIVLTVPLLSACDRQWTGDIKGLVSDAETEEPVSDVLVTASSMKNNYSISAITGNDGTYIIHDARWGPNKVIVYHPDYGTSLKYADVIRDKSVELDFKITHRTEYVEPVITVWVEDLNEVPLENVRIDLYEIPPDYYDDYVYLDTNITDENGMATFQTARLYEDEIRFYQLRISAVGFFNATIDVTVSWLNPFPEVFVKLTHT